MTSTAALEISALRYRYNGAKPRRDGVLDARSWVVGVDALALSPGEQMLLTGGSGSGKSTLLHLIAGLIDPTEGTVRIAGRDMHALRGAARDRHRGRHVGMIFQTFNLLHGFSAIENVMAALMFSDAPRGKHRTRAAELLAHLGIDAPDAMPDEMSIGQQQRIAVARAVACGPELVLADEPTASLDPPNAAVAMDLIQETCRARGAALLCVSHDPSMASRFGRRGALADLAGLPAGVARAGNTVETRQVPV